MKKIIILLVLAFAVGVIVFSKIPSRSSKSSSTTNSLNMYYSCKFGYGVGLPKGWVVNDDNFASNQEILLMDKTKDAIIKINASIDEKITSITTVNQAITKIKEQMTSDPNIKLESFKELNEDGVGGYLAVGEQTIDQENYIFQSQGLININSRILQFHGVIKTDKQGNYPKNVISEIVASFVVNKELACKNSSE